MRTFPQNSSCACKSENCKTKHKTTNSCYALAKIRLTSIRNGQSCSAFGTTRRKYLSTVFGSHTATEAVLVFPLSVGGLISSFAHSGIMFLYLFLLNLSLVKITGCKSTKNSWNSQFYLPINFATNHYSV